MSKRIISPYNNLFPAVQPTQAWQTPTRAAIDIQTATGIPIHTTPHPLLYEVYFHLYEGTYDSADFACLKIDKSGTASWTDPAGNAAPFSSTPSGLYPVFITSLEVRS